MCGAFYNKISPADFQKIFNNIFCNIIYDVAPSNRVIFRPFNSIDILRWTDDGNVSYKTVDQWSLLPSWAKERVYKDKKGKQLSTFNARLENVSKSATWRTPWKRQRCLIPARAFIERVKEEGVTKKRPIRVEKKDRSLFFMAGLWDCWTDQESGEQVESATILTTIPNKLMHEIGHHRCPVIIDDHSRIFKYLDPDAVGDDSLRESIKEPFHIHGWQAYKIGYEVNYQDQQGEQVIEAIGEPIWV